MPFAEDAFLLPWPKSICMPVCVCRGTAVVSDEDGDTTNPVVIPSNTEKMTIIIDRDLIVSMGRKVVKQQPCGGCALLLMYAFCREEAGERGGGGRIPPK